jgi:hypothetical protein
MTSRFEEQMIRNASPGDVIGATRALAGRVEAIHIAVDWRAADTTGGRDIS